MSVPRTSRAISSEHIPFCKSRTAVQEFFFFNDTATTDIYNNLNTLSLHDALPISSRRRHTRFLNVTGVQTYAVFCLRSEEHTSELQSHSEISYAVFCLKKKQNSDRRTCCPGLVGKGMTSKAIQCAAAQGRRSLSGLRPVRRFLFFFFNDTATTEIYTNLNTLSLHDAPSD